MEMNDSAYTKITRIGYLTQMNSGWYEKWQ